MGLVMGIVLAHMIVPTHDKEASAKFFTKIFGVGYECGIGHFVSVRVNEALGVDFDN